MRAAIVVLGEVARSPRIRYHAQALANAGVDVDLVGEAPEAAADVASHPHIRCHGLSAPRPSGGAFFMPGAATRAFVQALRLTWLLLRRLPRPDLILVQTPPAIPTLAVAAVAAWLRGARLVVDWHNFGDSVLALRLGRGHPVVRLAGQWERLLAPRAHAHLCVSDGMRRQLADRLGIPDAVVFRDRPAAAIATASREGATLLRRRLETEAGFAPGERPALLVSATSWTADEDFDLVREACDRLEQAPPAPVAAVLLVVSGRGVLREPFERWAAGRPSKRVRIRTLWLPVDEYPLLLKAADLGISVHRSSSGVDLPMKVEDMLGAGLPVLALGFPGLAEQLAAGVTGLVFEDARGLAAAVEACLEGFPAPNPLIERLRAGVAARDAINWEQAWAREAAPVLGLRRP